MKLIDDFLNQITMYRLLLYCLIFLLFVSWLFSFFGLMPFSFFSLPFSVAVILVSCWVVNTIFARVFKVPTNLESVYITALILALIITPATNIRDFMFLFWASTLGVSSKYILNFKGKHIFNPAALGVVVTAFTINSAASWWVGTGILMPFVLAAGFLIVKKIQRFSLVLSFTAVALATILGYQFTAGLNLVDGLKRVFLDTPIIFFAAIMLTEPLTSPPTKVLQMVYGVLVGLFFAPFIHIGSVYFTPEMSLLIGNIFSYAVSPKYKLLLRLKEKKQIGSDLYDFIFDKTIDFIPGQYMEWTLGHKNPDSRGSRRYLTLASSPTEGNLMIGVKFYPNSSSWKKTLMEMKPGDQIMAGYLAGEFNLPREADKKLVFIAGGIGITPFRSMIKYLLDTGQKRDIVLLYSVKTAAEIAYRGIIEQARGIGVKPVYITTDTMGRVDAGFLTRQVPDLKERHFYISGVHSMVDSFKQTLDSMGIPAANIKEDFFPGYV